jgi:hypothetical protein
MKKPEKYPARSILMVLGLALLAGCGQEPQPVHGTAEEPAPTTTIAPAPDREPYIVELRAVGKTFQGPAEIPSGWTTFRFVNASSMIHFALIDVPPDGVTAEMMSETVMQPFQLAMDAMNAGDEQAVNAAFSSIPEWIGELGRNGGPGFLSAGRIGQSTVFLEPGYYIIECYVKSEGIFHSTPPAEGQLGMIMGLTVTDEANGAPEPTANVTLAVRNSGFEITSGRLQTGSNTIRVDFVEQQALPSFVGNDVHLIPVNDADSIEQAAAWLDWRTPDGLEDPAPVPFLGGLNDLPAGAHGYFTVVLEAGDYAFIAEMPNPQAGGFVLPVTVD